MEKMNYKEFFLELQNIATDIYNLILLFLFDKKLFNKSAKNK